MKEFKGCKNYTLIKTEKLEDVDSVGYVLKHDKTGARVCLIANDDENKSFMIGFRTIPTDSTGVPHILEHSVLCGSERFPVKDAMTEVGKGSLNTFMNAFTYPDRTLYPVASCNDKDFSNLVKVYLDAVFKPMVYFKPNTFRQEGWHYELDSEDGDITINGVVYNEMKGVYSNPEDVCQSVVNFSLFPDTQYGVESGGDPRYIPDLTYEQFLEFHKRLYHPSNSRIFLYGDMDFEEKLRYMDEEYLSKYEMIDPHTEIMLQKPFDAPQYITKEYSLGEEDDEKNSTFLTYNVVCADYTEIEIQEAMNVINYALCSVPGAKLKERLIDAGIGQDVYSTINSEIGQPVFSIVAQNANAEDEERFVNIIEETIKEIITEGFDRKPLEASITGQEFSYREADYGFYPRGIVYGMFVFDSWNYSDEDLFTSLRQNALFKDLRAHLKDDFYEKILKERILDNPHKTILKVVPVKGLSQKQDDELKEKLKEYKASLSAEEIKQLIEDTVALKKYQEEPDTPEALATIPTLSIDDVDKKIKPVITTVSGKNGVPFVEQELFTNGIAYVNMSFSFKCLPRELFPYMSIGKIILGQASTKSYKYGELVNEIAIKTGSLHVNQTLYKCPDDSFDIDLECRTKVMYDRIPDAMDIFKEILFTTDWDDKKRIKDILGETKTRIQGFLMSSGHAVAISRLGSYFSKAGAATEVMSGMDQVRLIDNLLANFDQDIDGFVENIKKALSYIVNINNLTVSVTAEKEGLRAFEDAFSDFLKNIPSEKLETVPYDFTADAKQEAFTSASQVQYVGMGGSFLQKGLPYTGSLSVLRNILSTDYLWTTVRLQGGAYGAMCSFSRLGEGVMVSYRDPNLSKTVEAFKGAIDYIKEFPDDEALCERFVISSLGDIDTPLTPSMKAQRAFSMYKQNVTNDTLEKEREQLLSTTPEVIRGLSRYIEAVLADGYVCCVGGEEAIKKDAELFKNIVPLINA